ncbi:MAG: hypothetical protein UR27_C0016G0006 [Candidatus Peregrinibacteria bacterium GW2011_GWA2_33_10]|nr:MAG: hypothetical protein UR27_C0016G0006 [Candidatus Peregrinibacteria bacterium GW2011_GWA2_33_10]KKP38488.1 MAG: hypothetical protein UR30_C0018G0015 [Candidatus Peregrinibacteria bacterium GW2011_GWC2_33_13]OGJ50028.1 MAG: hypothetical protein A2229_04275 [Candidatus Peregrinibacteria bacterium RIFOXYA2_FULL_33_7]
MQNTNTKDLSEIINLEQNKNPGHAYDNAVISWETPQFIKHQKGKLWFVIGALIVFSFVIWGLVNNSWTMSIAFLAFAAVYYISHLKEPKIITIKISQIGIKIGADFYPYSSIKYFWIIYKPPYVQTLHLKLSLNTFSEIEIQLSGQDPSEIRDYLLRQIPEIEGKEESFSSVFARLTRL